MMEEKLECKSKDSLEDEKDDLPVEIINKRAIIDNGNIFSIEFLVVELHQEGKKKVWRQKDWISKPTS